MAVVLNKAEIARRRAATGYAETAPLFIGDKDSNLKANTHSIIPGTKVTVAMGGERWDGTESHAKIWNSIEDQLRKIKANAANTPSDLYDLINLMRIDITRRRMQEADYTSAFSREQTNFNFSKSVNLDEFLEYGGAFEEISGTNDSLPLIEQKTGATGAVTMVAYGLGWKTTLDNELYNTIHGLEKVSRAVTRGYVGLRNNLSVGQMVAKTVANAWDSAQKVAASTTSGSTPEDLLYETLNKAIETLINLLDPQTGQEIDVPTMALMCRPTDVRRINRAISGQLNVGGKGKIANREALGEIAEIWPYRGDTIIAGEKKTVYPGVAANKAYLFVPQVPYTLVKRPLTSEIGSGDVLQLAREVRAWYTVQTQYQTEFFGGSAGLTSGTGFVVEITLPAA